nr:hypothetical protein [Candidatus Sigynarchaeota archaeon]
RKYDVTVYQYDPSTKEFIASTMPSTFPFHLSSNTTSFSLTTLPDDHVVSCYVVDGGLWYKESYTRGLVWYDPELLFNENLADARNLVARSIRRGNNDVLLVSWDALVDPSNASSRRAFYAIVTLSSPRQITGPLLSAGDASPPAHETFPSIAGNDATGYCLAWVTNMSGHDEIRMRAGPGLSNITHDYTISPVDGSMIRSLFVLVNPGDGLAVVYQKENATHDELVYQPVSITGGPGASSLVMNFSNASGTITSIDVSVTATGKQVVSFQEIGFINNTMPINVSHVAWIAFPGNISLVRDSIMNSNGAKCLQHVVFSNEQVLTIWLDASDGGDSFSIFYSIIDFDMTNRNSIYHSILLAYVFAAAGVFNLAIHKYLKRRVPEGLQKGDSEPWNNIFISLFFFTLSVLMVLPFSGFQ